VRCLVFLLYSVYTTIIIIIIIIIVIISLLRSLAQRPVTVSRKRLKCLPESFRRFDW
jgi:hypothetical protein